MDEAKVLKIVFCGPGDVARELDAVAQVIDEWNMSNFDRLNCGLRLVNWKKSAVPSMEKRGQAVINDQLIDESDLMIAVFWRRFGTPTGMFDSGTAEEVQRAIDRGIPVLLYFSDIEAPRIEEEPEQVERLGEFRRKAMTSGLPWSFSSRKEFEQLIRSHLDFKVREILFHNAKASMPEPGPSVSQIARGDGNVQLVGDSNQVDIKTSATKRPKVVVEYGDGYLSPAQQKEVSDMVAEFAVLLEQVEGKTTKQAMAEAWSRLHNKFKVAKYELLRPDQLPDVEDWYLTNKRILQGQSRRKAPAVHKRSRIPAIKAGMRSMGRTNEDYYPEIAARLKIRPFSSLTKLSGKNLEKVYQMVLRDKKKSG